MLMDRGNRVTAINARLRGVYVFLCYCFDQKYMDGFPLMLVKEDESFKELNKAFGCNMTDNDIFKVANSRLGLYRRCSMDVVNYLLSQKVLAIPNKKENRPGLVDPLAYYLRNT